jgi:hypothetical protein
VEEVERRALVETLEEGLPSKHEMQQGEEDEGVGGVAEVSRRR